MLQLVVIFIAHSERQQGISRFVDCSVFLGSGVSIFFLVDLVPSTSPYVQYSYGNFTMRTSL